MKIKSLLKSRAGERIFLPVNTPSRIKVKFISAVLALNEHFGKNILECDEDTTNAIELNINEELPEVQKEY